MDMSARIRGFLTGDLAVGGPLTDDTPLLDGALDSLALLRLVAFLEEEFDVEIDEQDITASNFRTVADICRLVERTAGTPS